MDIIEQMNDLRVELESLEFVDWVLFNELDFVSVFYDGIDVLGFMVRFWESDYSNKNMRVLESVIRGFGDILEHFMVSMGRDCCFDIYVIKV